MAKYLLIILSVLLVLGCAPDHTTPGEIAEVQIDVWEWSNDHYECGHEHEYPEVFFVTFEELKAKAKELNMKWTPSMKGIYEGATMRIYIINKIDDENLTEGQKMCFLESIMAHEMIHYIQASCGEKPEEAIAYELQACYVESLCGLWLFDENQERVEGRCYD